MRIVENQSYWGLHPQLRMMGSAYDVSDGYAWRQAWVGEMNKAGHYKAKREKTHKLLLAARREIKRLREDLQKSR